MLYKCLRWFLFQFDPEFIHSVILFKLRIPPIRWMFSWLHADTKPGLERTLFGIKFKNPVGLAAGFDKNAKALLAWQALGFGFVEVGTVTPKPQPGNEKPRILRFVKEKAIVNWMGFNNDGVDRVIERIKKVRHRLTIPIGLNIGKNKDTPLDQAVTDYVTCVEKANDVIDFFVINVSSPNTPELRKLQEPDRLDMLFLEVQKVARHPVLVKLSPDLTTEQLTQVCWIIKKHKIAGVVATNTTIDYSTLPGKSLSYGGISGDPLRFRSNEMIKKLKSLLGSSIPIIGVGGIMTKNNAQEKFSLGASLVEIYTGFIYEGPRLLKDIKAVILLLLLIISTHVYGAMEDPYNSYQWNRENLDNGKIDTGDWYEWWFYKVNDPKTGEAFFFCYGVVNPWDEGGTSPYSRAFVTFGDFQKKLILSSLAPVSKFKASYDSPAVQVGTHGSDARQLEADFSDLGHHVQWNLSVQKKIGWNAMGWGMAHPALFNIYWYPAQMDAEISGTLILDGKTYLFERADGYQDRNWGRTFPQWWFWMSVNSFQENPESSLVGGGGDAQIPYGVPVPTAILLALHHDGRLYEFRSSEPGYVFNWDMNLGQWEITATGLDYRLKIKAFAHQSQFMDLQFPTPQGKVFHDYETLHGKLRVQLYQASLTGWEKIVDLSTPNTAGLEYGMDQANLKLEKSGRIR